MPRGFRIRRDDTWVAASRSWRDQYIVDLAAAQPELTLAQIGADYVQPPITSQAVSAIIRRMRAEDPAGAPTTQRRRGRAAAGLRYIHHDLAVLDQLRRRASEQGLSIPALAAASGLPITRVRQLCTLPAARMWVAGARRNFKDLGLLSDCLSATGFRYELITRDAWKPTSPMGDGCLFALLLDRLAEDPLTDARLAHLVSSDPFAVRRLLRGSPGTLVEIFECDLLAAAMGAGWAVIELVSRSPQKKTMTDLARELGIR